MVTHVGPYLSTVDFVELPFIIVLILDNDLVSSGPPENILDLFVAEGTVSPSATNLPTADGFRMRLFISEIGYGTMPNLFQRVALPTSSLDISSANAGGDIVGDCDIAYCTNSVQISPVSVPKAPTYNLFMAGMLLLGCYEFRRYSILRGRAPLRASRAPRVLAGPQ
jgi:hypothetical protein